MSTKNILIYSPGSVHRHLAVCFCNLKPSLAGTSFFTSKDCNNGYSF